VRDFRRWLWSDLPSGASIDQPRCAHHALAAFLRSLYDDSISKLNAAWATGHEDFAAIVDTKPRPVPTFATATNAVARICSASYTTAC
jgi:hypothetical protein